MKKIMFNDRYGLTNAVIGMRKTQTRRVEPDTSSATLVTTTTTRMATS